MRILFERTGGFTGIKRQKVLDSADLPPAEVKHLERLLLRCHFFDLPQELKSSSPGIDGFHYKLTVETEEGSQTVLAGESAVPASMRPLLHWLEKRAC